MPKTIPKLKQLLEKHQQQSSSLFRGVDLKAVQKLLKDCPIQELDAGDVLISAGRPHHFLYLLLSGRLRIHLKKLTLNPIAILDPGEVADEMSVIDRQAASAFVVAHEDCQLLVLDEETIWRVVESFPIVARNLLLILSQRLRQGNVLVEASLLEKVSAQELEDFQPLEIQEGKWLLEEEVEKETVSLYRNTTAYVLDSIRRVEAKKKPDIKRGEGLVKSLLDSVSESSALLLLATDRIQEFAVSTHSVNVAILSLRLAQTLNLKKKNQIQVGLAALLHEIGVAWLPKRLLHQAGQVSSQVRQRPVYGAKILGHLHRDYDWLAQTVGQVYEREDGRGFPLGLEGGEIRQEAKILGLMDVFEACIHDRPYRNALTGYELLHELTHGDTTSFSDQIVKALLHSFSLYPYNEYVLLNTKELGRVVAINPEFSLRPLVRILYDKEGRPLEEPREADLAQNSLVFITKAISYHELPQVP